MTQTLRLATSVLSVSIQSCKDPKALDDFMKALDMDGDGKLSFLEFGTMIISLTALCHDHLSK
ncbi:hypothetical protein MATL_G00129010 [Scomber scombrus]|uniref:EF-hand domain-containing protein n=1 Tax=Scomber scombrus TaxID=13677 RepID=A0AAV1PC36_SCOSC